MAKVLDLYHIVQRDAAEQRAAIFSRRALGVQKTCRGGGRCAANCAGRLPIMSENHFERTLFRYAKVLRKNESLQSTNKRGQDPKQFGLWVGATE